MYRFSSVRTILLSAVLATSTSILVGCMASSAAVNRAHGYAFTIQNDTYIDATRPRLKPNPAYYGLLPLALPFDIVTSPIQMVFLLNRDLRQL